MQTGSLHAVIIVVLFVALMGTLGVVFYQNFIAKKEVIIQKDTSNSSKSITARVAFDSDIYSLKYPDGWNVATKKIETSSSGGSITTITNADKTVQVALTLSEQAPSDACSITDGLKLSYYH